MDADAPIRRARLSPRAHLPALAAYAIITILLTWPLVVSLGRAVPHDLGDPLMSAAILSWNAQQVPFTEAWWNGPFFFPASDTLALSDHRVGLGVFSTPLIWMGATPVTVYNITFLLTWWLSACAAYALAWTLTSNRAAAFVAGCVFGFNPFRTSHLPHLELLAAYCLPIVLLALHQWRDTRKTVWLFVLAAVWLLQALTSGYFFFFMGVFVALWLLWFVRDVTTRALMSVALALIAPLIIITPVLLHYQRVHDAMGLSRSVDEIKFFSADLSALVTAPESLLLWKTPSQWRRPEGELMPGLAACVITLAGWFAGRRIATSTSQSKRTIWFRRIVLAMAIMAAVAALIPLIAGPLAFNVAGIDVSMSGQDKPLSVAFVFALVWGVTSPRLVAAFRSQSPFAFYCMAVIAMWLLALGPEARLLGAKVLYRAPYSVLMLLPGFSDSFRAPARFGMLAVLALSVAVAVAFVRITRRWPTFARAPVCASLVMAVMLESWIYPFPLVAAPPSLVLPPNLSPNAIVLELPMGVFEDATATLHAVESHHRSINGLSGYEPPHYGVFSRAMQEGNDAVLNVFRRYADIAVIRDLATTVLVAQRDESPPLLPSRDVRISGISADRSASLVPRLTDNDYDTAWETGAAQTGHESLVVNLAEPTPIIGVRLSSGRFASSFARRIAIDLSADGVAWTTIVEIDGGTATLEAALRDQKHVDVVIQFPSHQARHVRIRQTGQSSDAWAVAEVRVLASPP